MAYTAGLIMHIQNHLTVRTRRELEATIMHRPGITMAQIVVYLKIDKQTARALPEVPLQQD